MKKQLFTFVMMLALVIVGGSAMAQTKTTPYIGGTYSYTLSGLKVISDGSATVSYSGAGVTLPTTNPITVTAAMSFITFDLTYTDAATSGILTVTLLDGAGCSNFIEWAITVKPKPALAISILASEDQYCQNKKISPLSDNMAASSGATTNSFTFTVSPTVTNVTSAYSYAYNIALPNLATTGLTSYAITHTSGDGAWTEATGAVLGTGTGTGNPIADTFTLTFTKTTGINPKTITGLLSAATLTVNSGTKTYTGTTPTASDAVDVKTMPSIGSFN